jgi:hypothetical protein
VLRCGLIWLGKLACVGLSVMSTETSFGYFD